MIAAVRFPLKAPGAGYAFDEMNRRQGDFAIVSLAAMVSETTIRLGVGGVAATPTIRDWVGLEDGQIDDALNAFAWDLGGDDDIHATGQYRRELVRRLGRRTIKEAMQCRN